MKFVHNQDIKSLMRATGVTQYDLSVILGCSEQTVHRLLRRKLTQEEHQKVLDIIEDINKEEGGAWKS